ncbi:DUF3251 domain-containing protein, partial [Erwinia oleae]|uniref:DUF3251 domain-containing protein n=1 Tax=Erwinia oleae TaxID=796334 RepID=UPI000553CF22
MASRALSRFYPLPIILLLAGCVSPQKQPELNQLHSEVSKLNNEMYQLTRQAASLEQQNSLNGNSAQGAW